VRSYRPLLESFTLKMARQLRPERSKRSVQEDIPVCAYWRLCRFSTDENNLHGNGKLLCVCNFVSMASRPPLCSPALPSASCVTVRPPGPHLPDLHPLRLLLLLPRAFFESPTVPNAMQCNAVFFFRDFYL
jgi:hypothetical protein